MNTAEELRSDIQSAIEVEQEYQRQLQKGGTRPATAMFLLLSLTAASVAFLIAFPTLYAPWVVASFLTGMLFFVLLMLPTTRRTSRISSHPFEKASFASRETVQAVRTVVRERKAFYLSVLWNLFYVNSEPLTFGFLLLFGTNIVFAVFNGFYRETIGLGVAVLIILQSSLICFFYLMIFRWRPFSATFTGKMGRLRSIVLSRDDRSSAMLRRTLLLLALAGFTLGISAGAILLPGLLLRSIETGLGYFFGQNLVAVLIVLFMQVTVLRTVESIMSRRLVLEVSLGRVRVMQGLLERLRPMELRAANPSNGARDERIEEVRAEFLRTQTFRFDQHDLFGLLPVQTVAPNYSVLLDLENIEALSGTVSVEPGPFLR